MTLRRVMQPISYVTDLSHFYDSSGAIASGKAGLLARYLGLIVEPSSRMEIGAERALPMPCSIPTRRGACAGNVHVARPDAKTITWHCPFCGLSGLISGWAGAEFDLGQVRVPHAVVLVVPLDLTELDAARRWVPLSPEMRARLADASSDGFADVELHASVDELVSFDTLAKTAADAERGDKRRWLDRFSAKCEVVHRHPELTPSASSMAH
jgi:hypothetical protein